MSDSASFIHLDGRCLTCGERWGTSFPKRALERKVAEFQRGDTPFDPVLPCGHPLRWGEKDYRAALNLFRSAQGGES